MLRLVAHGRDDENVVDVRRHEDVRAGAPLDRVAEVADEQFAAPPEVLEPVDVRLWRHRGEVLDTLDDPHLALFLQPTVDGRPAPGEQADRRRAHQGRLARHRAAGADHEIGLAHQGPAVDRVIGHDAAGEAQRGQRLALLVVAGEDHRRRLGVAERGLEAVDEQRVLEGVVERPVGGGPGDDQRVVRGALDPEPLEHRRIRGEVGEVELLLEARVEVGLGLGRALLMKLQRLERDSGAGPCGPGGTPGGWPAGARSPWRSPTGCSACALRRAGRRSCARAPGRAAGTSPSDADRGRAGRSRRAFAFLPFGLTPPMTVTSGHRSESELDGLRVVARGHQDGVPGLLEAAGHRAEEQRVRRVGVVDPDAHR